jgi:hypothetical protein
MSSASMSPIPFLFFLVDCFWGRMVGPEDMVRLMTRFTPPYSPNPRNPKPYFLQIVKKRDLGDGFRV